MLTLRPTGGLCNRMLAIDSALLLCEEIDHDLTIHWVKNHYLNASYRELFQPLESLKVKIHIQETTKKEFLHSDRELAKHKQLIYNGLLKVYQRAYFRKVIQSLEVEALLKSGYDFRNLRSHSSILISSFHRFFGDQITSGRFLPEASLQQQVTDITRGFSGHMVGIHIRRGDHKRSILRSPTSLFITRMHEELIQNPEARFYLASDSTDEKRTLKAEFEDRLIMLDDQTGDRNSSEGMKRAVIDLYCLAGTTKIYGSFYSTFSKVASELKRIPFEELKDE